MVPIFGIFVPSPCCTETSTKTHTNSVVPTKSCVPVLVQRRSAPGCSALARASWATWSAPSSLTHSRLSPVIFTCAFRKLSSAVEPAGEQGPRERPMPTMAANAETAGPMAMSVGLTGKRTAKPREGCLPSPVAKKPKPSPTLGACPPVAHGMLPLNPLRSRCEHRF